MTILSPIFEQESPRSGILKSLKKEEATIGLEYSEGSDSEQNLIRPKKPKTKKIQKTFNRHQNKKILKKQKQLPSKNFFERSRSSFRNKNIFPGIQSS